MKTLTLLQTLFSRDFKQYEGVRRINIYLLRLLFTLMFLTYDSWKYIFTHTGPWNTVDAAAWCMWGAYSSMSFIGIFHPLKMLPIVLFDIIYKSTWLIIVAFPLWLNNELAGSPAEYMTMVFSGVIVFVIAMPWGYFFRNFIVPTTSKIQLFKEADPKSK
ncbi:hypothetical protein [Xanthocytophaga flava]|uniref:hypothetical protein n=1 Tax=Xanthocytophaga flava TaxID=3048013 RepID=UPI0028D3A4B5|nr:hypothetical protein [Xanthocytophaga flavus]MDJ1472807.1 hypothetical protein [Xanthocytophaga flavus]